MKTWLSDFCSGVRIDFTSFGRDAIWCWYFPAVQLFKGSKNLYFRSWLNFDILRGPFHIKKSGITGVCLFKMLWKYFAHLALGSPFVEMVLPFLFLTDFVLFSLLLTFFWLFPYNLLMFCRTAAFLASVELYPVLSQFRNSFFTLLFNCLYLDVRSLFLALSLHPCIDLFLETFLLWKPRLSFFGQPLLSITHPFI